jgi:cytochrome c oxidase cbb3-type subunit III
MIPSNRSKLGWLCVLACAALIGAATSSLLGEPQQPGAAASARPAGPQAISRGQSSFRLNCAPCHGMNAEGGMRAPNLTTGRLAHGGTDQDLFATILRGIPGTDMPANDLSDDETWEIVAYLRSLRPPSTQPLSGDPAAGEKLFFGEGRCSACHMVQGKGGRLGPDLSRVGAARPVEYLIESIRDPDKHIAEGLIEPNHDFAQIYELVTVTLMDGTTISGVALNEDSFSLQLMDTNEQLRLLSKNEVKNVEHSRKSPMPAYGPALIDEKQLQDLVAYLHSLRGTVMP